MGKINDLVLQREIETALDKMKKNRNRKANAELDKYFAITYFLPLLRDLVKEALAATKIEDILSDDDSKKEKKRKELIPAIISSFQSFDLLRNRLQNIQKDVAALACANAKQLLDSPNELDTSPKTSENFGQEIVGAVAKYSIISETQFGAQLAKALRANNDLMQYFPEDGKTLGKLASDIAAQIYDKDKGFGSKFQALTLSQQQNLLAQLAINIKHASLSKPKAHDFYSVEKGMREAQVRRLQQTLLQDFSSRMAWGKKKEGTHNNVTIGKSAQANKDFIRGIFDSDKWRDGLHRQLDKIFTDPREKHVFLEQLVDSLASDLARRLKKLQSSETGLNAKQLVGFQEHIEKQLLSYNFGRIKSHIGRINERKYKCWDEIEQHCVALWNADAEIKTQEKLAKQRTKLLAGLEEKVWDGVQVQLTKLQGAIAPLKRAISGKSRKGEPDYLAAFPFLQTEQKQFKAVVNRALQLEKISGLLAKELQTKLTTLEQALAALSGALQKDEKADDVLWNAVTTSVTTLSAVIAQLAIEENSQKQAEKTAANTSITNTDKAAFFTAVSTAIAANIAKGGLFAHNNIFEQGFLDRVADENYQAATWEPPKGIGEELSPWSIRRKKQQQHGLIAAALWWQIQKAQREGVKQSELETRTAAILHHLANVTADESAESYIQAAETKLHQEASSVGGKFVPKNWWEKTVAKFGDYGVALPIGIGCGGASYLATLAFFAWFPLLAIPLPFLIPLALVMGLCGFATNYFLIFKDATPEVLVNLFCRGWLKGLRVAHVRQEDGTVLESKLGVVGHFGMVLALFASFASGVLFGAFGYWGMVALAAVLPILATGGLIIPAFIFVATVFGITTVSLKVITDKILHNPDVMMKLMALKQRPLDTLQQIGRDFKKYIRDTFDHESKKNANKGKWRVRAEGVTKLIVLPVLLVAFPLIGLVLTLYSGQTAMAGMLQAWGLANSVADALAWSVGFAFGFMGQVPFIFQKAFDTVKNVFNHEQKSFHQSVLSQPGLTGWQKFKAALAWIVRGTNAFTNGTIAVQAQSTSTSPFAILWRFVVVAAGTFNSFAAAAANETNADPFDKSTVVMMVELSPEHNNLPTAALNLDNTAAAGAVSVAATSKATTSSETSSAALEKYTESQGVPTAFFNKANFDRPAIYAEPELAMVAATK